MATKKKPTHEIRFGEIRRVICSNVSSTGDAWFSVVPSRSFKDDQGQWQDAFSFSRTQLPNLMKAIEASDHLIASQIDNAPIQVVVKELGQRLSMESHQQGRRTS